MTNPIIIVGAKGLGKVALDIFQSHEVIVYGFLDDDKSLHNTEINLISVLGSTDDETYLKIIGNSCDVFVASDENSVRRKLVAMFQEDYKTMPVNAIHAQASIASTASIGHGNLMNVGVILASHAFLGNHNIIHTGVIIDYDAEIANFVQIGAGSIVNAGVQISENAFIGSGVTIIAGVKVGANARIGAGSVVIKDVAAKATVFGNPAQAV
jgi:sugar O-acyltransferase (sialic acid O-acetyltransferase NeuD family)